MSLYCPLHETPQQHPRHSRLRRFHQDGCFKSVIGAFQLLSRLGIRVGLLTYDLSDIAVSRASQGRISPLTFGTRDRAITK
jgi:hypothetical protein